MVDVAHRKKMCTSLVPLPAAGDAGSMDYDARLPTTVAFLCNQLNYKLFFYDGGFLISA
jgi:hypothetical protein